MKQPARYVVTALALAILAGCGGAHRKEEAAAAATTSQEMRVMERMATGMAAPAPVMSADRAIQPPPESREKYADLEDNPVHVAAKDPVSTFSLDVDTGSYSNVRRFLRSGELPPQDAVRVEEMVNYFRYDYPAPSGAHPFGVGTEVARAPWNPEHLLVRIGVKAQTPDAVPMPPANLVFLVDVSGSMDSPDKLPLVRASLKMLVDQLRPEDKVALVVYAGRTAVELPSTPGSKKGEILAAIDRLEAGGSTAGEAAIRLAYQQARAGFIRGGVNRILMATDGDFNVGVTDQETLEGMVERERADGISLSMLAYGTGNVNDALMEQLADKGNGNYSYIDSVDEARKVLVDEMASTLQTVAKDVKVQVEFNPALVAEYRLIGYENRMLREEDFRNDKIDAGEVGAGRAVTALYEVTPVGAKTLHGDRRYDATDKPAATVKHGNELAFVRVRYKQPDGDTAVEFAQPVAKPASVGNGSDDLRFAAAVAGFGQLLRGGRYTGQWSWEDAATLARGATGKDEDGWRGEFVRLVKSAGALQGTATAR